MLKLHRPTLHRPTICERFRRDADELVHGELDDAAAGELRQHAAACGSCAEELVTAQQALEVLASSLNGNLDGSDLDGSDADAWLGVDDVSLDDLRQRTMAAIVAERAVSASSSGWAQSSWLAAAAAAGAVLVSTTLFFGHEAGMQGTDLASTRSSLLQSEAGLHSVGSTQHMRTQHQAAALQNEGAALQNRQDLPIRLTRQTAEGELQWDGTAATYRVLRSTSPSFDQPTVAVVCGHSWKDPEAPSRLVYYRVEPHEAGCDPGVTRS